MEQLLTTLGLQCDEGNYSDQLSIHCMHPHCVAHYPGGYWLLAWPDQPLFRHSKHTLSKAIQAAARMAYVFTGVVQESYPLDEAAVREIICNTLQRRNGCFFDMAASRVISDLLDLNHPYAGEIARYWADRVVQQMVEEGEVIRVRRFDDRAHSEILLRQPQLSSKQ